MKLVDLMEAAQNTVEHAMELMDAGFRHGKGSTRYSCYARVGDYLRRNPSPGAVIRFWGIRTDRGPQVYHVDLVDARGKVLFAPPYPGNDEMEIQSTMPVPSDMARGRVAPSD